MKRILIIATGLVLLSSLQARAGWAADSKDVTVGPNGTSTTTHLVPVPDKAKHNQWDQCIVETAKQFKDQDEAQREVTAAREIIVQHNPQSMFRLRNNEIDDDGKITEFLKCYGYENVTAIDIDKVRALMSQRGIQHVWDLVKSRQPVDDQPSPEPNPAQVTH